MTATTTQQGGWDHLVGTFLLIGAVILTIMLFAC